MSWQRILAQGFRSAGELTSFLNLPQSCASIDAEQQFKTRVPRGFAARMQPNNPNDPLLLQVLAQAAETNVVDAYVLDPLAEAQTNKHQGLIHKYHNRVLITLAGACAIHCRYCFRRHFPYQQNRLDGQAFSNILTYIKAHPEIDEVILSGGDPLLVGNSMLQSVMQQLKELTQLRTLRFHTRIPVVLPERIDEEFLQVLQSWSRHKVMVLHINHPQEINQEIQAICLLLKQAGCVLLSQSVLLKGVNDCADTLARLSMSLFDCGILPYYLHKLDKVVGAAHFDLSSATISALYQQLQARLPGYLVPRLVQELPGKHSKTLIV